MAVYPTAPTLIGINKALVRPEYFEVEEEDLGEVAERLKRYCENNPEAPVGYVAACILKLIVRLRPFLHKNAQTAYIASYMCIYRNGFRVRKQFSMSHYIQRLADGRCPASAIGEMLERELIPITVCRNIVLSDAQLVTMIRGLHFGDFNRLHKD